MNARGSGMEALSEPDLRKSAITQMNIRKRPDQFIAIGINQIRMIQHIQENTRFLQPFLVQENGVHGHVHGKEKTYAVLIDQP
ncbi:MAG TPA: hypothetical protein ENI79_00980 [Rhodospirillales bacterium]|nr:hypothetical protein [Rhodospirillales bacterium]